MLRPWLIAALTITGTAAAQDAAPAAFPTLLSQARAALAHQQFAHAQSLFSRLATQDSANGAYWLGLGESEVGLTHFLPAISALKRALALGFGSRPERSYQIARLYARRNLPDSALAWLQRALAARYEHRPSIASDSAFTALHDDPTFRRLAQLAPDPLSRNDGWAFDLSLLVEEAKRMSTGPHPVARSSGFDSAAAALRDSIPILSNEQIYLGMQRLMAMLGNGHSVLFPLSTHVLTIKMLPIDLYAFSDGLYIVGGVGDAGALVGDKVERIGDLSAADALERTAPFLNQDNPMDISWNGPYFLTYPALLRALGAKTDSNAVRLELRDHAGQLVNITLQAGDFRPPQKLNPLPGPVSTRPLYLQHPNTAYWLRRLPNQHALYLQYNQVQDQGAQSIAEFSGSVLRIARESAATSLIVDVRRNNGGSGRLNRPLVQALVRFEGLGPHHRVFVIEGRNTFSAAQNFINEVEQMTDAVFAGEPSGSRPNFVGEDTDLLLPYSGIMGSVASRYFQDSDPLDERQWIAPDIPVRLSSDDYFANRDPVMAAVLEAISRGPSSQ